MCSRAALRLLSLLSTSRTSCDVCVQCTRSRRGRLPAAGVTAIARCLAKHNDTVRLCDSLARSLFHSRSFYFGSPLFLVPLFHRVFSVLR